MSNTMKLRFVGASHAGSKIDWPLRIVAKSIRMQLDKQDESIQDIFQKLLVELNDIRREKGQSEVTELPKSYTNKNASSLHYGMRMRFLEKIANKNVEALTLAAEFHLEVEAVVTEATTE